MNKWYFAILFCFKLTRSDFIYSVYNISKVPSIDNVCGLNQVQVAHAKSSGSNDTSTDNYDTSNGLNDMGGSKTSTTSSSNSYSSNSYSNRNETSDVYAMCSGDECFDRQRELVECLTYQVIEMQTLEEQLELDARSLTGHLTSIGADNNRLTAVLFDTASRLEAAIQEYYEAAKATDDEARALAEQRNVVHEACVHVDDLRAQLAVAKTDAAAKMTNDHPDCGVFATGCQHLDEQRMPRPAEHGRHQQWPGEGGQSQLPDERRQSRPH